MSNLTNRQSMYIEMCINYRTIALILSTFSYLSMFDNLTQIEGHIGIFLFFECFSLSKDWRKHDDA